MSGRSIGSGLAHALIGAMATLAVAVSAQAQIPARPVDPEAPWMTREEALAEYARRLDEAVEAGEFEILRSPDRMQLSDDASEETRFLHTGRGGRLSPRWYEEEARLALLAQGGPRAWTGAAPQFTLSRDGDWIAVPKPGFPQNELFVINIPAATGWRLRPQVETLEFFEPEFSPTDDVLAVAVHAIPRNGLGEIWLLDTQARLLDRIYTPRLAPASPDFSPDGARLAFLQTAPWETEPGVTGVAPEYSYQSGAVWTVEEIDLKTRVQRSPTDLIFFTPLLKDVFYSPDRTFLLLPDTSATDFTGVEAAPSGRIALTRYRNLPDDVQAFLSAFERPSWARFDQRRPLRVRLEGTGPALTELPASQAPEGLTSLVDVVSAGFLWSRLEAANARAELERRYSQVLYLQTPNGALEPIFRLGPEEVARYSTPLASARVSEDFCTLAFYENPSVQSPVLRIVPLCSDAPVSTLDLFDVIARSQRLQAGWSVEND